eukprot:m.168647 g.168647  ORF g.168647 m.168647 type:complete len:52 (+) comp24123_c0_seq2:299-454(+)
MRVTELRRFVDGEISSALLSVDTAPLTDFMNSRSKHSIHEVTTFPQSTLTP